MVVKDAVHHKKSVCLAIHPRHLQAQRLRASIGVNRRDGGRLILRQLLRPAEDLAGGSVKDAGLWANRPRNLQKPHCRHAVDRERFHDRIETAAHMRLPSKMINFIRPHHRNGAFQCGTISQITDMKSDFIGVFAQVSFRDITIRTYQPVHLILALQQMLCQVRTVLSGDAGDKRANHFTTAAP